MRAWGGGSSNKSDGGTVTGHEKRTLGIWTVLASGPDGSERVLRTGRGAVLITEKCVRLSSGEAEFEKLRCYLCRGKTHPLVWTVEWTWWRLWERTNELQCSKEERWGQNLVGGNWRWRVKRWRKRRKPSLLWHGHHGGERVLKVANDTT